MKNREREIEKENEKKTGANVSRDTSNEPK